MAGRGAWLPETEGAFDMTKVSIIVSLIWTLSAGTAFAADIIRGMNPVPSCSAESPSSLVATASDAELRGEIVDRMDQSVAASESDRWIHSSRPVFLWANEAKAACGIAYGYLKTSYRDEESIGKCGCFYDRMRRYMN
jgi:hypothetical protein